MTRTTQTPFVADISRHVWETKYRYREGDRLYDHGIEDTWRRISHALASVEQHDQARWEEQFYRALSDFRFLPGGRIQAGAGVERKVTLFNCFVMGIIEDSMDGIFEGLKEGALTMQQGGGVGYDFSTLRPRGTAAHAVGAIASGPVSFMKIWDSMCATLLSTGARRGAMMGTLRCDHPDIEDFITAKQDPDTLRHFNISVLVSDAFMDAVRRDNDWELVFPVSEQLPAENGEIMMRRWSGASQPVPCRVIRRIPARTLWNKLMRATYEYAEPGVLFIDRINQYNNLWYREQISATNPCVTADTWVHTTAGPRRVHELVGRSFTALVNGKPYAAKGEGFFTTGVKTVYRLHTREGYALRLTGDHPVLRLVDHRTQRSDWTCANALQRGDTIILHNHRDHCHWPGPHTHAEGYLLGTLIVDGRVYQGRAEIHLPVRKALANALPPTADAVMQQLQQAITHLEPLTSVPLWVQDGRGEYQLRSPCLNRLIDEFDIRPGDASITPAMERGSSEFYRGLLRAIFDSRARLQVIAGHGAQVRLTEYRRALLAAVQRMLLRLGVTARIENRRRGTNGVDNELMIDRVDSLQIFADRVGFTDAGEANRLQAAIETRRVDEYTRCLTATVEGIETDSMETVFDVQIPGINAFDANGLYVHNCGEIPLPPYGACDLGSINLTRFVREPFTAQADLDLEGIGDITAVGVRLMDNVIDLSQFPLERQAQQARGTRHVGLGFTGLADILIMLGLHYGEPPARELARRVMQTICHRAYQTSVALAREKGPFPYFDKERYLRGQFVQALPQAIREGIDRNGIRNSHLTAIAPTGTISLLANNVSSGLEPVYDFSHSRRVLELDGSYREYALTDYAYRLWQQLHGDASLPHAFVSAQRLKPADHLAMQAAVQPHVDNSISKTINVPEDCDFEDFKDIYQQAYDQGLKGCTTFRPNSVTGSILSVGGSSGEHAPHCCNVEREAD
jgi:ribonucleoside-diphosphate reductase alpha chain